MSESKVGISIGTITGGQNNIGETSISGDQVMNINALSTSNATEVIEQVEREFQTLAEEQTKTVQSDPDAERHEYTDPKPVFEELKLRAAEPQPEPEAVESAMVKFKRMISERGPQIGKALCNGVVAGLQATVATHPVVVAVTSFLKTFND